MAVIAEGEIDLKLSAKSQAALENDLAKRTNKAGTKAGDQAGASFTSAFTKKTSSITGSVKKSLDDVKGQALVAGVGAAAGAIALFAVSSIRHFEDTALSVRTFQRVTGQTAEDASHLVSAFDDMGISASAATNAMGKLAQNTGDGGKKLQAFGIDVAKTSQGNVDLIGTFDNVRKAISNTEDPAKRIQIAVAAFGKTGKDLLPILRLNNTEFEALKKNADLNFNQKQLDQAESFRRAMDNLDDSVGKVKNRLGADLVPVVTRGANALAFVADKASSAGFSVDGFVSGLIPGAGILGLFSDKSKDTGLSVQQLAAASSQLGVSIDTLKGKTQDQIIALLDEKKALDDVTTATLAGFDAGFAYQDSLNAQKDAAAAVTEKQNALAASIRDHGAASTETADARDQLERSLLAQQEAALRSAEAMGRLAEQNAISSGATDTSVQKIDAQIASLERSKTQVDARNIPSIQGMIDRLKELRADYSPTIDANTGPATTKVDALARHIKSVFAGLKVSGSFLNLPDLSPGAGGPDLSPSGRALAGGGSYPSRMPRLTGEKGWELDFPSVSGRVISHADAIAAIRAGAAGITTTPRIVNNYVTIEKVAEDPEATAFAVTVRLGERSQR